MTEQPSDLPISDAEFTGWPSELPTDGGDWRDGENNDDNDYYNKYFETQKR